MKMLFTLLTLCALTAPSFTPSFAASTPDKNREHAQKTLEIYKTIVEIDSSANGADDTAKVASYLASEFIKAGFPAGDVEIVKVGDKVGLIVKYHGKADSSEKPILFLGHMDVVEADAADWKRPPFKLTKDDKFFFGRGSDDNKFGLAQISSTFIRLKKAGFEPNRELIIAFSGDEETGMSTTKHLAYNRPDLAKAEFALNTDAGGGSLSKDGKAVAYMMQAAEKTYVTFEITARNPGGHSSRPRPDNAIYDLADAIKAIQGYDFPVMSSPMTRDYFRVSGKQLGGELGAAMIAFADNPDDKAASDRLKVESSYIGTTRTTCVATMLKAGHAENAMPQSATATVNCRIFPGVAVKTVLESLKKVIGNQSLEYKILGDPTESPISVPRDDVTAAVAKAVHARYPNLPIIPFMASGGTDGMHFRSAGVPTWAISSLFMNPDDNFAHGLNERAPIKSFYDALDHWTIIIKELAQ